MTIRISLADALTESFDDNRYKLCGLNVFTDVSVPWLSRYTDVTCESRGLHTPRGLSLCSPTTQHRTIVGVVAGRERRLEIENREHGLYIEIESVGEFLINADGSAIRFLRRASGVDRAIVLESVLGAPLILSLALRGRWFLHASAVNVRGRVVAFAGRSGAGKSKLAAHLSGRPGITFVSDDVLCYGLQRGIPVAGGEFPQLKLPAEQQPNGPPQTLAAVMVLVSVRDSQRVSMRQLQGREKLLAFIEHGVATRAFPPPVLAKNLKIAAQIVENMDVIEVQYPKTQEALRTLTLTVDDAGSRSR